jgi:hypothetical protein
MIKHRTTRYHYRPPEYYMEGFGLMESGVKANRDSVLLRLDQLCTQEPTLDMLSDISDLASSAQKDLLLTYMESLVITNCYYFMVRYAQEWAMYLKYYFLADAAESIQLIWSSENFDFYALPSELPYIEDLALDMEKNLQEEKERFEVTI